LYGKWRVSEEKEKRGMGVVTLTSDRVLVSEIVSLGSVGTDLGTDLDIGGGP
jgi:hypothetical protein